MRRLKPSVKINFPRNTLIALVEELGGFANYRPIDGRSFRFLGAFPRLKVAVEFDSQNIISKINHEKYNAVALRGWVVLRYTAKMVRGLQAERDLRELAHGDWSRKLENN
jgi:hypothetical protein